jgi:hypothetical protein
MVVTTRNADYDETQAHELLQPYDGVEAAIQQLINNNVLVNIDGKGNDPQRLSSGRQFRYSQTWVETFDTDIFQLTTGDSFLERFNGPIDQQAFHDAAESEDALANGGESTWPLVMSDGDAMLLARLVSEDKVSVPLFEFLS